MKSVGRTRKILTRVWLRGFLPAILCGVLWAVSPCLWAGWQAPGNPPFRMLVARGVWIANWGNSGRQSGFGKVEWKLGYGIDKNKAPKPGVIWANVLRRPETIRIEFDVEAHPGHVKVPLYLPVAVLLMPPLVAAWRRSRRRPPYACRACGYDLRGGDGETCPECGNHAKTAITTPRP